MASCDVKSVIKALRYLTPIVSWYIYYSVFLCSMCNLGSFFCLWFSFACPSAFFWMIVFSYLCFNLASSRHISEQRANMCGSVVTLVVIFVAACEVQCSAVRLARDHSGCGPLSMTNFRVMRMRVFFSVPSPLLNLRQSGAMRLVYLKFCT